ALPAPERAAGHGRADIAQSRLGDPQCGRTLLHRPWRQTANAGMGHHGCGGCALHFHRQMVAGRLSGPGADADGAVFQSARRRRARYSRPPHAHMTPSLLALSDLHVTFSTRRGLVEAVRGVTLSLGQGEMLGLVGESGSGKSVTGFAITRLLDAAGRIT